ncbi:MAG: dihydrofolate reductase, partial [Paramuribaculum sp.]|nr:dihydrofolate reductase [Paramuribaculum sp.]
RRNIVITTDPDYSAPGIETAASLEQALAMTADAPETMIIGGGQVYSQALPLATVIYLTEVDASLDEADTFFPEIDREQWTVISQSNTLSDEASGLSYRFVDLQRL